MRTDVGTRLLAFAFLLALACGCARRASEPQAVVTPLLGSGSFRVEAEELGTRAEGSVLVYEKERGVLGIRLAAQITVGPEDWGGAAFSFPAGCRLENVLCSYPEDGTGAEPPVNVWTTAGENEKYTIVVEIARSREQEPTGGGAGTVVIDVSFPCGKPDPPDRLDFAVECGGRVKNGSVCWGEAYGEITVEIRKKE